MQNFWQDEQLDQFFSRLNKPLAKMPAQERAEVHAELRQHLDALIAAHEELGATPNEVLTAAIKQFGDPAKISKRLVQEWRRMARPKDSFWAAFWHMSLWKIVMLALSLVYAVNMPGADPILTVYLFFFISPLLAGFITGWKMPERAASGAFYSGLAFILTYTACLGWLITHPNQSNIVGIWVSYLGWPCYQPSVESGEFVTGGVVALDWLAISCVGAYAASAKKRGGFYRLRRADFSLGFKRRTKRLA